MLITYQKHGGMHNCFAVVPEETPWRLETAEAVLDGAEGDVRYALNLVVNQETVDTLLLSDDFWNLAIKGSEAEMTMTLFNEIIEQAADEMENVLSAQGQRLDLGEIIEAEVEFWCKFQESWEAGKEG